MQRFHKYYSSWRIFVGLEVHAQLKTRTKIFSKAPVHWNQPINSLVAPFDRGEPGSLPVLNKEVIPLAIRTALLFNCHIESISYFDRKHYQYDDLPVGYQITQKRKPFAKDGFVEFILPESKITRRVSIKQLQLEHDSGKTIVHDESGEHLIDLNRCGVGLIEIVLEPTLYSAEEAVYCAKKINQILVDGGVSDGVLAHGNMRFDVNVSVIGPCSLADSTPLGVKVELKNLNSYSMLHGAINAEVSRQVQLLEVGGRVTRETRSYDEEKNVTLESRKKEDAGEYCFIPEFDLPALQISDEQIKECRAQLPLSREDRYQIFFDRYKLDQVSVDKLIDQPLLLQMFENIMEKHPECIPKITFNLLTNRLMGELTRRNEKIEDVPFRLKDGLSEIALSLSKGEIDDFQAKEIINVAFEDPSKDVTELIKERFQSKENQSLELPADMASIFESLCVNNPKRISKIVEGSEGGVDFFVGQLMKVNKNRISPSALRPLLLSLIQRRFMN